MQKQLGWKEVRPTMRKESGFTLVELMVVVLIIAILVAIAVPVFSAARESAWRRTCQANLRTIDGAAQTYFASYGVINNLDGTVDSSHPLLDTTNPFLKSVPTCPQDGSQYDISDGGANPQNYSSVCANGHTY